MNRIIFLIGSKYPFLKNNILEYLDLQLDYFNPRILNFTILLLATNTPLQYNRSFNIKMLYIYTENNHNQSSQTTFLATCFSATTYSLYSNNEPIVAITNDGKSIRKVIRGQIIRNQKYRRQDQGFLLYRTQPDFLLIRQQNKQRTASIAEETFSRVQTQGKKAMSSGEGLQGWRMIKDWQAKEIVAQGMIAGIIYIYNTSSTLAKVLHWIGYLKNIFSTQLTSATALPCLSVCQNLAYRSFKQPFPVEMLTWLKGAQMGTDRTSPWVFQRALMVVWQSQAMASAQVSQKPILANSSQLAVQLERGKVISSMVGMQALCMAA